MEDKTSLNRLSVFLVFSLLLLFNPIVSKEVVESSEECPLQLKAFCRCGSAVFNEVSPEKPVYVVNCSYVNLSNVTFLHYLPAETEVLLLNNNNLTSLPNDLLVKPENYKKLAAIDLSNNNLIQLHNETFKGLSELRILNLNDNQIQITGDNYYSKLFFGLEKLENLQLRNAFGEKHLDINFMEVLNTILIDSKLINLKVLNLAENHIRLFNSPFTFCSLPNLEKLYLSHNLLADQIELNLNCTPKLFILDLSNNYITKIANSTIENYDDSKLIFHLNLTNNPFDCDCQLSPFIGWIQQTKVWVVGLKFLQCERGFPETNIGRYIHNMTLSDLQCRDTLSSEEQAYQQHLVITYSIVISLIASIVILLTAVLLVTRKSIAFYWQELSNSIAKKRDYAPLDKHQTAINQQSDNLEEDQFEEASEQQKQSNNPPATEIVEDVV